MKPKYSMHNFGDLEFKCYYKPAGHGYEIGVMCAGKPLFVGNFVHPEEANTWWKKMNMEIKNFTHNYEYYYSASPSWYCQFFTNKMYSSYYMWLDQCFMKYTQTYKKAFSKHQKTYKKFERHYNQKMSA